MNWDAAATSMAARSLPIAPYSVAGGDLSGHLRLATGGLEFGADVGLLSTVDRRGPLFGQVLAQVGYAYLPRPFEGRLGYDFAVSAGGAGRPVGSGSGEGPVVGPRAALLVRLTDSHDVWTEDVRTTLEAFLVLGGQSLVIFPLGNEDHTGRVEYGGLLGLRVTSYSNGAP